MNRKDEDEYEFTPEEIDADKKSIRSAQVKSHKSLTIPGKVSKLGVKIKEIFFNKYHAKEIHRLQSHRSKLGYKEEIKKTEKNASVHLTY